MKWMCCAATALALCGPLVPQVQAEQKATVKIASIDPLSGGAAAVGRSYTGQLQFMAAEINAKGGLDGRMIEILSFDNKTNPQESIVAARQAIDRGARIITQGAGSAVGGALVEFVRSHNERNPGEEVIYLNFGAVDPALTNEKCSYGHFRFDATTDMKTAALVNFVQHRPKVKKVYLINQDYSFGRAIQQRARLLLKEKRPDIAIVGDEVHPLLKITDFSPYVAKIKASGADAVITGNWGQDFALLLKAAAESGLQAEWYTYYGYLAGGPTAIKQTGLADRVFTIGSTNPNDEPAEATAFEARMRQKLGYGAFQPISNQMRMLVEAARAAKSTDAMKLAAQMEDMTIPAAQGGVIHMRKDDHQASEDLFLSSFGPLKPGQKFDEENTGWGWTMLARIAGKDTVLPTTCKMKHPGQDASR